MKRTILVIALVLASTAQSDEAAYVDAAKMIQNTRTHLDGRIAAIAEPINELWRTEVCEPRARVYRAMRTIREQGVSLDEALSRVAPLEDQQRRRDLDTVGVSTYADAVHAIYKSSDPTARVHQLDQECLDAGDYKKPDRPEIRAVNCSRVQGAALREKHDQLPQLKERCLEIRKAAIEASSDIEFRMQVNRRADKAEQEGWEKGMSAAELQSNVNRWLSTSVHPTPVTDSTAPKNKQLSLPLMNLLVIGGVASLLFLVVIMLRRKG